MTLMGYRGAEVHLIQPSWTTATSTSTVECDMFRQHLKGTWSSEISAWVSLGVKDVISRQHIPFT